MADGDRPREQSHSAKPGGFSAPTPAIFAANIMALVTVALLFDDEENSPKSQ
jgi:hypothetical protein